MKLIYRGTAYNYDSTQVPSRPFQQARRFGSAYNLIYRGVTYHVDPNVKPVEVPVIPAVYNLIYRGITYLANSTAREVTVVTHQQTP